MRDMQEYRGKFETRVALQMSAYLIVRPGELRQMEWLELDFEGRCWNVPGEKMKAGKPHIVPLSQQAPELLEEIQPLTGHRRYVFTSATDPGKPMSNNTVRQALRRMGYGNNDMTAHGFRTMASTRFNEMGFSPDVIEKQLAHAVGNEVRRAYDRSQHIAERTTMMQQWADYLDGLRDGAQVIPFRVKLDGGLLLFRLLSVRRFSSNVTKTNIISMAERRAGDKSFSWDRRIFTS